MTPEKGSLIRITKSYAGNLREGEIIVAQSAIGPDPDRLWPTATYLLSSSNEAGWVEFEPYTVLDTEPPPALLGQTEASLRAKIGRQRRELSRLSRQARTNKLELESVIHRNEECIEEILKLRKALRLAGAVNDA